MGIDVRRARRALRASGARASAVSGTWWPIGRQRRLLGVLRQRRAVLEAKNNVVDFLARTQRALAELGLTRLEQVEAALREPEKKRLILSVGASRHVLAEELASRYGAEGGRTLDDALSELIAQGVILRVPAKSALSNHDLYLVARGRERARYDIGELNRLLQQGRRHGSQLRSRARREGTTGGGRTYDM